MKTIEYQATYSGVLGPRGVSDEPTTEVIRVQARDINAGFAKALRRAQEPLGNGNRRELIILQFWQIP